MLSSHSVLHLRPAARCRHMPHNTTSSVRLGCSLQHTWYRVIAASVLMATVLWVATAFRGNLPGVTAAAVRMQQGVGRTHTATIGTWLPATGYGSSSMWSCKPLLACGCCLCKPSADVTWQGLTAACIRPAARGNSCSRVSEFSTAPMKKNTS